LRTLGARFDEPLVVGLRGLALGAPEGFRQPHEIAALGVGDETREREQLAALLARHACEHAAVRLDRAQQTDASGDVVVRNGAAGFDGGRHGGAF
jgi:hypothetical protein